MARLDIPEGEGLERERVWHHKPAIGAALDELARAIYSDALLSVREQEFARMRVVLVNGCHF